MRKRIGLLAVVLLCCFFAAACSGSNQNQEQAETELTVSAAASLQNVLNEIKTDFENDHKNINLTFNFGGSGSLQQQISQGAPADMFFSAAEDKFQILVEEGKIEDGIDLIGNDLVLIVSKDTASTVSSFEDLLTLETISIGTPETVPAGMYAKEALTNMGLWDKVNGNIVYAKDVRQVLTYVETGNVDAGIVYRTDGSVSEEVEIVASAPEGTHKDIIYPVGILKESDHQEESKLFYDYLQSEQTMKIFNKYGFKGLN
ncbi:molybdate ABC transporter substrate-binding protein [Cytobacillus gottheilii]|uniref:molybdate ABC transporter substrate-binding protein n=1 Tax=Cytobacillus gottheilii TaxID=859144 RepID=UPI0009B9326B|nr:molybdate ABC transporter substrate-binding protein [Cytobacillus gottheilii]